MFPILKKFQIEHRKRYLLTKFEQSSILTKISKMITIFYKKSYMTPEFSQEISKFLNYEYVVLFLDPELPNKSAIRFIMMC
jgi:hypothetical protein